MEHQDWKTIYVKSNKHHDSKTQTQQNNRILIILKKN